MQSILQGTIKALGYQTRALITFIVSFYIISLPIGYYLTFVAKYGYVGILLCHQISAIICFVVFTIMVIKVDWVFIVQYWYNEL